MGKLHGTSYLKTPPAGASPQVAISCSEPGGCRIPAHARSEHMTGGRNDVTVLLIQGRSLVGLSARSGTELGEACGPQDPVLEPIRPGLISSLANNATPPRGQASATRRIVVAASPALLSVEVFGCRRAL